MQLTQTPSAAMATSSAAIVETSSVAATVYATNSTTPSVAVAAVPSAALSAVMASSSAAMATSATMTSTAAVLPYTAVARQTMGYQNAASELYHHQQQLQYQPEHQYSQYYQLNNPGSLVQQYQPYGYHEQYNTQPQMQGGSWNAAQAPAQSAPHVEPQVMQLSQRQHIVSQSQIGLRQIQAPAGQQHRQHNTQLESAVIIPQMRPESQIPYQEPHPQANSMAHPLASTQVGNWPFYSQQHIPQQQFGQSSQIQHQLPQVQQFHPPTPAVTSNQSYPRHQQVNGFQNPAPEHLSPSKVKLQGQQSNVPPRGTQPTSQQRQHVGNHAQMPVLRPSVPFQTPQRGVTINTQACKDIFINGGESSSHGPALQGNKEPKVPDTFEKQWSSQRNLQALKPSSMGPQHQQKQTANRIVQVTNLSQQQTSNTTVQVTNLTQQQTSNSNMQVVTQQQPNKDTIKFEINQAGQPQRQQLRAQAYATHKAQQYSESGDPRNYEAPGVLQPWAENGWEEKTLLVSTSRIAPPKIFLDLNCSYLGAVFRNSEAEAVKHCGTSKLAYMKFSSQAHAAAVLDKFNGRILPGWPDRILSLSWLNSPRPPPQPRSAVKGNTRKRKAESSYTSCSKRDKINISDIFQPFEHYIALGDRKIVESADFRAAYVVGSIKPIDPGSPKVSATRLGSDIIDGLFSYAKQNHKLRKTWGGKFMLEDLLVSESGCCIARVPDEHFCSRNVKLDDDRLVELLFPFYEINGHLPPYFSDLKTVIKNAPNDMETNEVSLERYINKVLSNPALSKAHHRIKLLEDFYKTFTGLPLRERDALARKVGVVDDAETGDWREVTNRDKILQTMYTDNWKLDKFGEEEGLPRFNDLLIDQAVFLRHLTVHGLQTNLLHWRQIFEDLCELDLIIYHYYPDFYPYFVDALLELDINYPVMHTVLRNYNQR